MKKKLLWSRFFFRATPQMMFDTSYVPIIGLWKPDTGIFLISTWISALENISWSQSSEKVHKMWRLSLSSIVSMNNLPSAHKLSISVWKVTDRRRFLTWPPFHAPFPGTTSVHDRCNASVAFQSGSCLQISPTVLRLHTPYSDSSVHCTLRRLSPHSNSSIPPYMRAILIRYEGL